MAVDQRTGRQPSPQTSAPDSPQPGPDDLRWIGRRVQRVEDLYLLAGRATFLDDLDPRGTLHAGFVRPTVAPARIASTDVSPAVDERAGVPPRQPTEA